MTLSPQESQHFIEAWHDFYLLAGTASVTLVGLLFLALSFNLDVLVHDRYAHVLAYARNTMFSFVAVLLYSFFFLVPQWHGQALGMQIMLSSVVFIVIMLSTLWRAQRHRGDAQRTRAQNRRTLIALLAYAGMCVMGFLVYRTHDQSWFFLAVGLIAMILGNAAGSAWDLLVEVGKLKLREAEERRAD